MSNFEKLLKVIETVGEQWPFLIVVSVITILIIKWKTIWSSLGRVNNVKIKKGDSEFELSTSEKVKQESKTEIIQKGKVIEDIEDKKIDKEIPNTLHDTYLKLREGKFDESKKIFDALQKKAIEPKKTENIFIFLFYEFVNGIPNVEGQFIEKINDPNNNNSLKALGYKYLGLSYKGLKQFEKAINTFNEVLKYTDEDELKNEITIQISDCYIENDEIDKATLELLSKIKSTIEDKHKSNLYIKLAEIYDKQDNKLSKAIALEQALYYRSNDTSVMFDIAYCYSETDFEDISIYHYLNLINIKPSHETALNNLGVGYKNKGLNFEAVNYYKNSVKNNESLAASNLANLYMENGFEEEAKQLFNQFISKPDVHKNLISAQSKLFSSVDNEKKIKNEIKNEGFKLSKFFRKYATYFYEKPTIESLKNEKWTDDERNHISVLIDNGKLKITWQKTNEKLEDNDIYEISGIVNNQASTITYKVPITKTSGLFSSLSPFNKSLESTKPYRDFVTYSGFCILDIDHNRIELLYKEDKKYVYLKLTKPSA